MIKSIWLEVSIIVAVIGLTVTGATAQTQNRSGASTATGGAIASSRRLSETPNGSVGRRQSRNEIAPNAAPMARVNSRIASRVQLRIGSRIERYFAAPDDALSAFGTAANQARTQNQPRQ